MEQKRFQTLRAYSRSLDHQNLAPEEKLRRLRLRIEQEADRDTRVVRAHLPWRGEAHFTFLADNEDEAGVVMEAVGEAVEEVTGVPTEGGACERMREEDIVEGSPLDKLRQE